MSRLQMLEEREAQEQSLSEFLKGAWKYIDPNPYVPAWHIDAIAEHLEAVTRGQIRNLLINQPPRSSKSSCVSVAWPAWVWAQELDPEFPLMGAKVQFLFSSYAQTLSFRDSLKTRRLITSAWYQERWRERFSMTGDQNAKVKFENDRGGYRMATSVGGTLTGEGGSCFLAGTKVATPNGAVRIEMISPGDIVQAFDHLRGKVLPSKVTAIQRRIREGIYEIRTASGIQLKCTRDHPIFVEGRGYIRADHLWAGDRVYREIRPQDHPQPDLRRVRGADTATTLRGSQVPWRDILFAGMPARRAVQKAKEALMFRLRRTIRRGNAILLKGVRWNHSFHPDDRCRELSLPRGPCGPLFVPVPNDVLNRQGAGWDDLRRLRMSRDIGAGTERIIENESPRPSSQPRHAEQRPNQPHNPVHLLPQEAPSWNVDVVLDVRADGDGAHEVYDIQVEGFSNFFAEGVLVHNCLIFDDPHNVIEIESDAERSNVIEWWDSAFSTRLNDPKTGAYVGVMQRLHTGDLAGHILANDKAGDWVHLCLPMRHDTDRHCVTSIGWEDPREKEGELLCPDRFGEEEVRILEAKLGPWQSSGQLQQLPKPKGGGIIKYEYWMDWDEEEMERNGVEKGKFPMLEFVLASADTAYGEKEFEGDYSALTVWGIWVDHEKYRRVMLLHAWRCRQPLHELVGKIAGTCNRFKADRLLIEAKASGLSVAQEIRRLHFDEKWGVVLSDPKKQDKIARTYAVEPFWADGYIYAPPKRDWVELLKSEMEDFPKGLHDDMHDSATQAIRFLRDSGMLERVKEHNALERERLAFKPSPRPLYEV